MKALVVVMLAAIALVAIAARQSGARVAASSGCGPGGDAFSATSACLHPGTETLDFVADHRQHPIRVTVACTVDLVPCTATYVRTCTDVGLTGRVYDVREGAVLLDWQACLTRAQARAINASDGG